MANETTEEASPPGLFDDITIGNTTISLDSISDDLKQKFSSWKTGVMNQYLLNEDVYVYDFANAEPMICTIMGEVPCCRADGDFWKDPVPEELKKWKSAWYRNSGIKISEVNCPVSFGLEYEGKNACWLQSYPELKCEDKDRDMCIYDKNGVPCCTKKLDLVHGWFKSGWNEDDPHPMRHYVELLEEYDHVTLEKMYNDKWPNTADVIYHVNSYAKVWDAEQRGVEISKTRYNFECPTYHPVPTVAILLGCFIPITIILIAILGIMWYRGKNGQQNDKKETPAA